MSDDKFLKGSWLSKLASVHERPMRVFELSHGRLAGVPFAVRWVSHEDRTKAIDEARRFLVEHGKWDPVDLYSGAGAQRLEEESQLRLLAVALVDPKNPDVKAGTVEELRKLLDTSEVQRIFDEWDDFQAERSPWRRWKSPAEFEADVEALGKGLMSEAWIRSFDSASLRSIVRSLASRLRAQTTDSSSPTLLASDSGSSSTIDE